MKRTLFLSRKFLKVEKKQCQDTKGFMKHTDQPKTLVTVKYNLYQLGIQHSHFFVYLCPHTEQNSMHLEVLCMFILMLCP